MYMNERCFQTYLRDCSYCASLQVRAGHFKQRIMQVGVKLLAHWLELLHTILSQPLHHKAISGHYFDNLSQCTCHNSFKSACTTIWNIGTVAGNNLQVSEGKVWRNALSLQGY